MNLQKSIFITCSFISLFICTKVTAQDAGEIQVYGSATTPKNTTVIELHSNYTIKGPKFNESYHPFLQTLQVSVKILNLDFMYSLITIMGNYNIQEVISDQG